MVLSITRNRNKILERDKNRANVQNCPISERATETTNVLFVRIADLWPNYGKSALRLGLCRRGAFCGIMQL